MRKLLALITALVLATASYAHEPDKGKNGGRQVDAGDYHVEMVVQQTKLAIYISDKNDKAVDAKGFKATGIFMVSGKAQRIELRPETANKLSGNSNVPLPVSLKGAVQITLPTGRTVQAKYE